MNDPRRHWLIRVYPAAWRRRYGDELDELLSEGSSWRDLLDVAWAGLAERLSPSVTSEAKTMMSGDIAVLARKPSAFAPIAMSLAALVSVLVTVSIWGGHRQPDEGAAAHIWQILIVGQLPFFAWFAWSSLRLAPKAGIAILALQAAAFGIALLPVWLLGL
jgi:hypothetical protein